MIMAKSLPMRLLVVLVGLLLRTSSGQHFDDR